MDLKTTIVAACVAFGASALVTQLISRGESPAPAPEAETVTPRPRPAANASYAALLDDLDQRIDSLQRLVDSRPGDWLTRGRLGSLLLERASLSNKISDFARTESVLADAMSIAKQGSGPLMFGARFNLAVHRLTVAEEFLDKIDRRAVPRMDEAQIARVLRAQIAVQRGQYEAALSELTEVAAVAPQAANAELALYHAKTGNPAEAEKLFASELETTIAKDPQRRAWLRLQLGVVAMERGELPAALERFREADDELSDWWLVREHIAEAYSRLTNHDKAIAILEELVRTVDLPQHMDALASLYKHTGRQQEADELIRRAGERWDQQLARFPEAAIGHALQHHLQFGTPERALELALANHEARPGGDAKVALARAYLKAGQPEQALAVAEQALASPYRAAKLHDVAAKAHAALGHTAAAEEQAKLCKAMNPWYSSEDHSH